MFVCRDCGTQQLRNSNIKEFFSTSWKSLFSVDVTICKHCTCVGEELVVTHVGHGIDEVGTLQVEIEVNGEVPLMQPEAAVYVDPFEGTCIVSGACIGVANKELILMHYFNLAFHVKRRT